MEWYKVKERNGIGMERGVERRGGRTTLQISGQVPVEKYSLGGLETVLRNADGQYSTELKRT